MKNEEIVQKLRELVKNHKCQYPKVLLWEENKDIYNYVIENTQKLSDPKYNLAQKIEWILSDRSDFPKCKTCGKPIDDPYQYRGMHFGYAEHCCMTCISKDSIVIKKRKTTTKERHGDENYRNIEKQKRSFIKHYGVDNNMKSKEGYEEYHKTIVETYGVDNVFQNEDVKNQSKKTRKEKYGDENYNNPDKIRETRKNRTEEQIELEKIRYKNTNRKKYGADCPMKNPEIARKAQKNRKFSKYMFDGKYFDSIPELCYYVFCKDNGITLICHPVDMGIEYFDKNGKRYTYYPDFYNVNENRLEEIKGKQFFKERNPSNEMINPFDRGLDEVFEAKHQIMIKNNVNIITEYKKYIDYVKTSYGKSFISNCKMCK